MKSAGLRWIVLFSTVLSTCVIFCLLNNYYDKSTFSDHVTTTRSTTKVILLAYYRSGSTLVGQVFNSNPAAFYWFEPLAAVTEQWGWDKDVIPPRNFYHFDNGTEKHFTKEDIETLTQPLLNVFQCDFNSTTLHLFDHRFTLPSFVERVSDSTIPFKRCMNTGPGSADHSRLTRCLPHLRRPCLSSALRVVKVIRLSMAVAGQVLDADPDVRVVHLVRDPRGMLESWWKTTPATYAPASSAEALLDAAVMCRRMMADCVERRALEERYPGRLLLVRYEDLVAMPTDVLDDIYTRLLKQEVPAEVVRALDGMINAAGDDGPFGTRRKNSMATASRWQRTMEKDIGAGVTSRCLPLLLKLGYSVDY